MGKTIRIGTRESQLAVWQAEQVKNLLAKNGFDAELVHIKSEGDVDLKTPLYEIGVQGIFTRSLDAALLNDKIDIAVHSMKDVPTQLAKGIKQAAILKRGPILDLLVFKNEATQEKYSKLTIPDSGFTIATSSIRRKAQWLNKFPNHTIENLRGNVNTRLRKLQQENWDAAIFAQAGLERINLRPKNSIELDWMLPAPAQGAIIVVCREKDKYAFESCQSFNHEATALCTKIERDFLSALLGGCSTPISALAKMGRKYIDFHGNIVSPDGKQIASIGMRFPIGDSSELGNKAARLILENGGQAIIDNLRNKGLTSDEA